MADDKQLTGKQKLFVEYYLAHMNATKAAKLAGYSEKTAYSIGYELLRKPEIKEALDTALSERLMSANEVLTRLQRHATASMSDFLKVLPGANMPMVDWVAAQEAGALDAIKEITFKEGEISFKLYDAQAALVHLGRHLALFTDKTDITSGGEVLKPTVFLPQVTDGND